MNDELSSQALGSWADALLKRLYPICRSLAGQGNRATLDVLGETLALSRIEVPSGTPVFDWTVPEEWSPKAALLTDASGTVWADLARHNLHVVNFSHAIDIEIDREELDGHLHSLPDQPDAIPYVTSYFQRNWGFCVSHRDRERMPSGRYRARIDAEHKPGAMSIGEAVLPGEGSREVLISTYVCHPSMANDNLSGVVAAAALYRMVSALPQRQFTWRFVFLPETIGSIAWLWLNRDVVKQRTAAGLVLSCVGDSGPFTYKQSRRGDTLVDRVANQVLRDQGAVIPFTPVTGSDERQYCSPGFDLPIGLLSRTYPGRFPEYHTSLDTPTVVTTENLSLTISALRAFAAGLEANARRLQRVDPHCEPMLSRRGLYHTLSIRKSSAFDRAVDPRTALMWVLSYCDGKHDLIDIAEKSGLPLEALTDAAERALHANLLTTVQSGCGSQ